MVIDEVEMQDMAVRLEEEDVWASLGSRDRIVPSLVDEVARGMDLSRTLCKPRGLYVRMAVGEVGRKQVSFGDGPLLEGSFVSHCFQGATEAVFTVVTIGPQLEQRVAEMFAQGDSVEAVVLDAVGSALVFNTFTKVAERIFEETTDRGWQTGFCLRPGESYWDITGQREIFKAVQADKIGIDLLESCFMVPQKSQSAAFALGSNLRVNSDPDQSYCRYCKAARCPMRQEEFVPSAILE